MHSSRQIFKSEKDLWSFLDDILLVNGRLMLNQPFENFSLVSEISLVNDWNPVPEIDQRRKCVEWEIGGQIRIEDPDKTNLENIGLAD